METSRKSLPPEAYQELPPGRSYTPFEPAETGVPEITARSVIWGLFMSLFFTFSIAYLGLKVGTVPEAAIPIAILAVGVGYVYKRKSSILENVIIQSIGSASGALVAGAIFTIPALYILGLPTDIVKIFLSTFLGGCLGVLFLTGATSASSSTASSPSPRPRPRPRSWSRANRAASRPGP
jgi:hypothetical protein